MPHLIGPERFEQRRAHLRAVAHRSAASRLDLSAIEGLAARGEPPAAFDGRCIPAGCVAPPSHTPGMRGRRALPAGRLARLGATPAFHHVLLGASSCCADAGRV